MQHPCSAEGRAQWPHTVIQRAHLQVLKVALDFAWSLSKAQGGCDLVPPVCVRGRTAAGVKGHLDFRCAPVRARDNTPTCQCRGSEARAIPRSTCFLQSYDRNADTQSVEPCHSEILSIMDGLQAHLQPACRANIIGLYGYSSALIPRQGCSLPGARR